MLLHDPDHDPVPDITGTLAAFTAAGAEVLVLAAITGTDGYDSRPDLDDAGWKTLLGNLDRLHRVASDQASAPSCIRTSERWSRGTSRYSGCSTAPRSPCASTPATC